MNHHSEIMNHHSFLVYRKTRVCENGDMANPVGRPSKYNDNIAKEICKRIAEGESVRSICRDEAMPCMVTIFTWIKEYPDFLKQYELAREWQADSMADEMIDIADDGTNDWMEKHGKDGESIGWMVNGEHVQRSRLRLDARKWIASKLKPKKYGDKTIHSNDPDNPMPAMQIYCPKEENDKS